MKITAVIMAGGIGERFWPKSRKKLPKQFLSLTDNGKTMIQLTAERHLPLIAYEDMFVVTNKNYVELVHEQLPQIPMENILAEPMAKNTAPCIGFASAVISRKYRDAVMIVLPSDHLINTPALYLDTISCAVNVACDNENLVTVGITPTYPEVGYGYINFDKNSDFSEKMRAYAVKRFVEKPDIDTAKKYLASGEYLWNSGMFIWKVSTILNKFKELSPDTYEGVQRIKGAFGTENFGSVLSEEFSKFKSESIDYGIMEKASDIYTIPGSFGWDDVGSWLAVSRINKANEFGNTIFGDVIAINTHDTIISGGNKLIATSGVEGLVIIDTDDALLVCGKDDTANVKKIIEQLKIKNRTELL